MKQLIPIIFGIMFMGSIAARDYSKVKYNLDTPFTGLFTEKRFTGIREESRILNGQGEEVDYAVFEYKHSKDGLRDTVFTSWGLITVHENIYSENNMLVGRKELVPDVENNREFVDIGFFTEYTYDSKDRIISVSQINTDNHERIDSIAYNYTDHTITHYYFMDKGELEIREFTQIEYTDSGYICWDTIYYNNQVIGGRDTSYVKYRKDEYIFESDQYENRLKRTKNIIGEGVSKKEYDSHIVYTDEGYTIFYGNSGKVEYFVNEKEQNTLIMNYRKGSDWELYERFELSYIYDDPQSNAPVLEDVQQPVYGVENGLVVGTDVKGLVNIYTISGQLVKQVNASSGDQIPLAKGFYIVSMGDRSYKVQVR